MTKTMASTEVRLTRAVYPFGLLALTFVLISIFATTFLSHPENDPKVIELASYLLTMGLVSFIILGIFGISLRSPADKSYNLLGMFLAFGIGLGFQAILRTFIAIPNAFSQLAITYSSVPLDMELLMFFVATIEELTFRVAIPIWIFTFIPRRAGVGGKWLGATIVSTLAFAGWHWFAYQANIAMIGSAMFAGVLLSIGYRVGELVGGGELSFLGIVAGHWVWNITVVPTPNALLYLLAYFVFIVLFVLIINRQTTFRLIGFIQAPTVNIRRILRR